MTAKKKPKPQEVKKKIQQIYDNYGLDLDDVDEDDMARLIDEYIQHGDIDKDLQASKKMKESSKTSEQE